MIKKILSAGCLVLAAIGLRAQRPLTPEALWELGRVGTVGISPDGSYTLYRVTKTDLKTEKNTSALYLLNNKTGASEAAGFFGDRSFIQWDKNGIYANDKEGNIWLTKDRGASWVSIASGYKDAETIRISPNGRYVAFSKPVAVHKVAGNELYNDVPNATAQVYTDLNFRHWDTWYDGKVSHLFVAPLKEAAAARDLLEGMPYDCPTKPFGGTEDYVWSPDSDFLVYVTKKKSGKEYAVSTNTDIYMYNIAGGHTSNLSEGMMGYDLAPQFNSTGTRLAWLSMARDGFEADKNDIIVYDFKTAVRQNLTQHWDGTVDGGFRWDNNDARIYFNATVRGTSQLFEVAATPKRTVRQLTAGQHDITGITGQYQDNIIVTKTDMNRAAEIFNVNLKTRQITPLSHANDDAYAGIARSEVRMRMVKTTDGREMGVWVIYPPNFDSTKKYPTLLYCQGGPQSAVSQFYSVRWNFQLMAANGYIVVAPNRRGLPGWGVEWNEAISKDWGGQAIRDYLSAIDDVSRESYVDKNRLGAVGASYGGYSVFMLAGVHNNRFKTFIAHCGLFDMRSWYGTTEEMWFANWDLGGNYWDHPDLKAYTAFNPSDYVARWNTPMLIIQGGLDFRVPAEQGLQAFKAAQLKGLKSKLLYFPNENHWVLHAHNGLVWQREFFGWLKETL
ncbi:MAG: S9 family peptidase [Bacteroidetes bacterium 47-18]|nr:MAG: S9 family peptidase [Bacteroidetes bacterium 47-18]